MCSDDWLQIGISALALTSATLRSAEPPDFFVKLIAYPDYRCIGVHLILIFVNLFDVSLVKMITVLVFVRCGKRV